MMTEESIKPHLSPAEHTPSLEDSTEKQDPGGSDLPSLTEQQMRDGLLIGVCGVQASGKTVFQTAVYHTLNHHTEYPVQIDSVNVGGASHFQKIEEEILQTGTTEGTKKAFLAQLQVPYAVLGGTPPKEKAADPEIDPKSEHPVFFFDFAGVYFERLADIKSIKDPFGSLKSEVQQVHRYLEACDGFIVLISATAFRMHESAASENPFPASVDYLVNEHCYKKRKPVSIVFTKGDLNPDLDMEYLSKAPFIHRVQKQFREDLDGEILTGKPFAKVHLLSCYEVYGGKPVKQDLASIWRPEAALVFLEVLQTSWRFRLERLRREAAERLRLAKELEEKRARQRALLGKIGVAILIGVLLIWAGFAVTRFFQNMGEERSQRQQSKQSVDAVRVLATRLEASSGFLPNAEEITLALASFEDLSPDPDLQLDRDRAIQELNASFRLGFDQFSAVPSLTRQHEDGLKTRLTIGDVIPREDDSWWEGTSDRLVRQIETIDNWLTIYRSQSPSRQIDFLNQALDKHLSDKPFRDLLAIHLSNARQRSIDLLLSQVDGEQDEKSRLRSMQQLLSESTLLEDSSYGPMFRAGLIERAAITLAALANMNTRKALITFLPADLVSSDLISSGKVLLSIQRVDRLYQSHAWLSSSDKAWNTLVQEHRQYASGLKKILEQILLSADFKERVDLWRSFLETLAHRDIFDRREINASGLSTHVPAQYLARLPGEEHGWGKMITWIEELTRQPLFAPTVRYIIVQVQSHHVRLRTIACYRVALKDLERGSEINTKPIEYAIDFVNSGLPEESFLSAMRQQLLNQWDELNQLEKKILLFNSRATREGKRNQAANLRRFLETQMKAQCLDLSLRSGDCRDIN